jgi:hypothetical protein
MHPLEQFDFAGPTTRESVEAHNAAVDQLGIDQAAVERDAAELAVFNPLRADPTEIETVATRVRIQKPKTVKTAITLLQARRGLLDALRGDWQRAQQDATEALGRARSEVVDGLRKLGFDAWLSCGDLVAQQEAARLVDFAAGPAALIQRLESLRDDHRSLMEMGTETNHEIRELTNGLQQTVRQAAALV